MKKTTTTLILALLLLLSAYVQSQSTQLSWTFDNDNTEFAIINAVPAEPSYALSITDGILKVEVNKKVNDWSFLQKYNMGLDLSAMPTLQFMVRSENGIVINFLFKDIDGGSAQINYTPTTAAEMEYVFLDLSSVFESATGFLPGSINELQINISAGWAVTTTEVTYFDYIKLGFTEQLGSGGDMYEEDFDAGLPPDITNDTKYTPSAVNGAVRINVHKQDRWQPMEIGLGSVYDFSSNPVVNIKMRTDDPMALQCFLVDEDGNGFRNVFVDAQYDHYNLVSGANEFRQVKVLPDDDYTIISFNFEGANPNIVDLTRIAKIKLCANGTAATFDGNFYIDHIWAGKGIEPTAYIGQIKEVSVYKKGTATRTLLIQEVKNAASITATGASALIKNVSVEPVSYTVFNENGYSQTYGHTKMLFELVPEATGSDTVVLLAAGAAGFGDFIEKFALNVTDNNPPAINEHDDVLALVNAESSVALTGISDGDAEAEQELSFEVNSTNTSVIGNGAVEYIQGYRTANLKFTPLAAGSTTLEVVVMDEDGASNSIEFIVAAYNELNGVPEINKIENLSVVNNSGLNSMQLSGISDGDGMTQGLTITATSSDTEVIPNPAIAYSEGENVASLSFTPVSGRTGSVTITVTVTDDGGNEQNNGNQLKEISFTINSIAPSLTGFEVNLNNPDALSLFGASGTYSLSIVDFQGEKALRIAMNSKSTWDGIVLHHPELNLVDFPMLSYDIYTEAADPTLYHWNYYFDVHGERCILNTNDHKYEAPVGEWTSLSFDYRQAGDMSNSEGVPIDASRISYLLINMHNTLVGWPFTEISAVCYMKNIKLGDKADIPAPPVYSTINSMPEQSVFENSEDLVLTLSGISNGENSTENVTVTASSSNTAVVAEPVLGTLESDGTMSITLTVGDVGFSDITVNVEAEGAEPAEMAFKVRVLADVASEFSVITIDRSVKNQTIRGIGTFYNEPRWVDLYATDMGASAVRIGIISNQWEPENDNDDPNVINMEGFNYDAFDWQYMRDLKSAGVETFILTSWSPPAWMKRSMTTDHTNQAIQWENTDNILEPYYYEEFAESMAAVVMAFKQEADIDILAIGLQNEPFFNEPYASAILGPDQFHQLIEVVGDRFAIEDLDHVGFFMPEQVFGFSNYSTEDYITKLRTNSKADAYTDFIGVHGYDGTGVDSNFPNYTGWQNLSNFAAQGENPKELWMTETHIGYTNFNSALAFAGALHGSLWAGNISLWTNWSFGDVQLTRNEPNSTFYATKQFAKYVRPGAVRVNSESDHAKILVTAYENSDGSFAIVVLNTGYTPVSARLEGALLPGSYDIVRTTKFENAVNPGTFTLSDGAMIFPGQSVTTLISNSTVNLTMILPADVTVSSTDPEQQLLITGISNGLGSVDGLTLEYELENEALVTDVSLSEITAGGEATFSFTPASDGNGQTKVTLTLRDAMENVRTDAFYITVDFVEGVGQIEGKRLKIYPNPTNGILNIELPGMDYSLLKILDITGKSLGEFSVDSDAMLLDLSNLQSGLYFIEVSGAAGKLFEQFVLR